MTIPGEVTVRVYEASRIASLNIFDTQSSYVKLKDGKGKKIRTKSILGGTAPRWTDDESNVLKMAVDDIANNSHLNVEVWNESQHKKNAKIDSVSIPVLPYAHTAIGIPKWHKLTKQGSLLFSVEFKPSETALDEYKALKKSDSKIDVSTIENQLVYHNMEPNARLELQYGDEIALHALGQRWMKFGSCMSTFFQKSKKCLQLSPRFDEQTKFRILGNETPNTTVKYGDRFHFECLNTPRVAVGTGSFEMLPANDIKKHGDVVQIGDPIYLSAVYAKTGTHVLGAEGESLHVFDPTIYISPHCPKVTFTITYPDGLVPPPVLSPTKTLGFKLTTFNVWMMPDKITTFANVSPKKMERAQLIPNALPDSDVVIFNEAFCHLARPVLLEAMKNIGYIYESPVVGHLVGRAQTKFLDGGVVIVSKFPIEDTDIMRFGGVCAGDDSLADKGVVYASIVKDGRRVHVFASHTQAWTTDIAVKKRQDQFRMMRNFIDEKCIPESEPVIVAGDFNVNKLLNDTNGEFTTMVNLLECHEPKTDVTEETNASFNAEKNPLAADGPSSDGVNERLDFILNCKHHLMPTQGSVKVNPIKASEAWHWNDTKGDFTDLSDHYPVTSNFTFTYNDAKE